MRLVRDDLVIAALVALYVAGRVAERRLEPDAVDVFGRLRAVVSLP